MGLFHRGAEHALTLKSDHSSGADHVSPTNLSTYFPMNSSMQDCSVSEVFGKIGLESTCCGSMDEQPMGRSF